MDPSRLAERIRGILGTPVAGTPAGPKPSAAMRPAGPSAVACAAEALGGTWPQDGARYLLVERRHDAGSRHGGCRVGDLSDELRTPSGAWLSGCGEARAPFVFLDLETTGLSGGAGTLAFLVGCGWFDETGAFRTRQYLLTRPGDERPMLERVSRELAAAGALVSFNGKSFDAPVLETRYLFHRLPWAGDGLPHLDMLHPSRRFWRDEAGCSLGTLELQVLGARRQDDVTGFEIPGRYFQFLRDGRPGPLAAVLDHNRLDLLSLAALTARVARLVRLGPDAVRDAREALALGHLLARASEDVRAREAFARAAAPDGAAPVRAAALRALAVDARRRRRFEEAAAFWRKVLEVSGCPPVMAREATAALAVHHEHRARDLAAARSFALRSLDYEPRTAWRRAVHHRLARLDRKLGKREIPLLG